MCDNTVEEKVVVVAEVIYMLIQQNLCHNTIEEDVAVVVEAIYMLIQQNLCHNTCRGRCSSSS